MSVRFLQWRKNEHPFTPSLVLFDDGKRYEPTIAIYRVDDGFELVTQGLPVTYERLHEAMKAGEAYVNDRETFENYPTPEENKNLLDGIDFGPELHLTGEPIPEPDDGLVHVDVPSFNDEVQRIVLEKDDVLIIPTVAIYRNGQCYDLCTCEGVTTYDRLHEAMQAGKRFLIEALIDALPVDVRVDLEPAPEAVMVSGEGYARAPGDIELETMPDDEDDDCPCYSEGYDDGYEDGFAIEEADAQVLECDHLHKRDWWATFTIGFAVGVSGFAIGELIGLVLRAQGWL